MGTKGLLLFWKALLHIGIGFIAHGRFLLTARDAEFTATINVFV
jgi:hypothetical protein